MDIRRWARANVGAGIVLVAMAGVEWFSLRHGTLGLLAGAAAGVVAIVLVVTSFDLIALALGTSLIASFTLSWNGFFVGPVRPGDVLALLAVVLFVLGNDGKHIPRVPLWMWQVVVGIVLLVALNLIFPPSDRYIAGRTIIQLHNNTAVSLKSGFVTANLFTGIKFIIALAAVPAMFGFAVLYARHYARRLIVLFAVGAALSGWVAILAKYGLNTINLFIGTHGGHGTRQIGLANQPNYLAAGVVIAVPIGMWLLFEPDRTARLLGAFTVSGCVLGAYASGSRGGSVTIVGAVGLAMLLIPRARKWFLPSILVAAAAILSLFLLFPSSVEGIGAATRLFGNSASYVTGFSDLGRAILADQAWRDFDYSPIHGIGLQVSFDAQTVYLQILQSGGILLMVTLMFYYLASIVVSFRLIPKYSLAAALCTSVIASLVLDLFEADLTDRFYYVPIGAIFALSLVDERRSPDEQDGPEDSDQARPSGSLPPTRSRGNRNVITSWLERTPA
jgi:hypothetical protein